MRYVHIPPANRRRDDLTVVVVACAVIFLMLCLSGCSSILKDLPPGSNIQVSTTGVRISPQAVDGPLILGNSTYLVQTPTPADSGPGLNRNQVRAGLLGVDITSTVATGTVGEQIKAAGGPEALDRILESRVPSPIPGMISRPATVDRPPAPVATTGEPAAE